MRQFLYLTIFALSFVTNHAFQCVTMTLSTRSSNRRSFLSKSAFVASTIATGASANAATTTIYTTSKGVKYAIVKDLEKGAKKNAPQPGDIVAIEYTGYLTTGQVREILSSCYKSFPSSKLVLFFQIFDATHAQGKSNALLFKLGNVGAVIPGLDDIVSNMYVGQKVQAIIPPQLAFGDKGICLEDKPTECLIQPGSTLVYDVYLKKATIPPP